MEQTCKNAFITPDRQQSETLINTIDERRSKIVRNRVFVAICRLTGDKWQSKTLFLAILILVRQLLSVFDCSLSVC